LLFELQQLLLRPVTKLQQQLRLLRLQHHHLLLLLLHSQVQQLWVGMLLEGLPPLSCCSPHSLPAACSADCCCCCCRLAASVGCELLL
jgi:hypothetical protein